MKKRSLKSHSAKLSPPSKLSEAVMSGNLAEITRLVQAGVSVNERKQDGFTPLMLAASRGNMKITEYLIGQGADLNLRNDIGQTALLIAAAGGHKSVIEQLVVAGADVKAVDDSKRNAIAWAASRGDFPEVISALGVLGADYDGRDVQGLTPLMRAALLGHAESVAILLTLGADENVKVQGKSAYDMASERRNAEVCNTMKAILANRPKGHHI